MRAFRIALLLPIFLLIWLVTTASMCPSDGPTESNNGRTADIQAFLEISPAVPKPTDRVQFEMSDLTINGNLNAYAAWTIAIYRGEWTGPLPQRYQPGASNLAGVIEMEGPLEPNETRNVRYRWIPEGTYTVVLYLSTSTQTGNRYRSAKRTLSVTSCDTLRVAGFKDTLTVGDGYDAVFRNLEDMGHLLQVPDVEQSSIPEAIVGEPFSFDLKPFLSTEGDFATFTTESQDVETGLTISEDGILSGTPLEGSGGLHWMRVRIEDHCFTLGWGFQGLGSDGQPRWVIVRWPVRIVDTACPALSIVEESLPIAVLNQPYSQTLTFDGGSPPVTSAVTSGTLPAGLTLSGNTISGTATAAGASTFTIRATDSCIFGEARTDEQTYTLEVLDPDNCPAIVLSSSNFPNGTEGVAYSAPVSVTGGFPPVTVALEGSLPPGLSLDASGTMLTGTPTASGSFSFDLRATDSCIPQQEDFEGYTIFIHEPPLCGTMAGQTSSMPGGIVGTPYTGAVSISGGEGAITMVISAGSLPTGLSLVNTGSSTVQVTGTPTTAGVFTFTVHATDGCGPPQEVDMPLSITIDPAPVCAAPPDLQITGLPSGTVAIPYSIGISASGGEGTLTYSVIASGLPPGLTLTTDGAISGTPTAEGTFPFTLEVADSCVPAQTDSQAVSITIAGAMVCAVAPDLQITGLPSGTVNTPYDVGISASNGHGTLTYTVIAGTLPDGLTMLPEGAITGTPTLDGTFDFTIQVTDQCIPQQSDTQAVSITIVPDGSGCNPLNLSPLTVQDATVGVFYEHFFGEWVNGGVGPFQFFIQAPTTPPPGMTIDQDTGTLSGTPTTPGEYQFIIQVTDSCVPFQSASDVVTLTVI